jgi:hypothetical protein
MLQLCFDSLFDGFYNIQKHSRFTPSNNWHLNPTVKLRDGVFIALLIHPIAENLEGFAVQTASLLMGILKLLSISFLIQPNLINFHH